MDVRASAPLRDPSCPGGELVLRVAAVASCGAVVEPNVAPTGRRLKALERAVRVVADRERDVVLAQRAEDRGGEPARVAKLDRVPDRPVLGCRKQARQAPVVARKALRQLPEDRPEAPAG